MPSIFEKFNQIKEILLDQVPAQQRTKPKRVAKAASQKKPKNQISGLNLVEVKTQPEEPKANKLSFDPSFGAVSEEVVKPKTKKKKAESETKPSEPWLYRKENDLLLSSSVSYLPLPLKQPKKVDGMFPEYIRETKYWDFVIDPNQKYGAPFGQDQLVLLVIGHITKLSGKRKVEIESLRHVMRDLDLYDGGSQYKRFKESIQRLFRSQYYIFEKGTQEKGVKLSLFDAINIAGITADYKDNEGSYVIIGEWFFKKIMETEIPYDLGVLRRLSGNPGAMRLYLKIAPRCFHMMTTNQKASFVKLDDMMYELGAEKYSRGRKQRQTFKKWVVDLDQALKQTGQGSIPLFLDKNDTVHIFPKKLVPGDKEVSKSLLEPPKAEPKIPSLPKAVSSTKKTHKEFDVDWVLEKELEAFEKDPSKGISKQANQYRSKKQEYEDSLNLN